MSSSIGTVLFSIFSPLFYFQFSLQDPHILWKSKWYYYLFKRPSSSLISRVLPVEHVLSQLNKRYLLVLQEIMALMNNALSKHLEGNCAEETVVLTNIQMQMVCDMWHACIVWKKYLHGNSINKSHLTTNNPFLSYILSTNQRTVYKWVSTPTKKHIF